MRYLFILLCAALLLGTAIGGDGCQVVNARESEFLGNRVVEGVCSNNGAAIRCTVNDDKSLTCAGPEGTYNGRDEATLVFSACGCAD